MNKLNIYLDLDGVVADFNGRCKKCWPEIDIHDYAPDNCIKLWEGIEELGSQFWTDLDKFTHSDDLVNHLRLRASDTSGAYGWNLYFLSSPGNSNKHPITSAQACYGKIMWVHTYYPEIPLILTRHKHLLANPQSLLIDDDIDKISLFDDAGGFIHHWMPKPSDSRREIADVLEQLRVVEIYQRLIRDGK